MPSELERLRAFVVEQHEAYEAAIKWWADTCGVYLVIHGIQPGGTGKALNNRIWKVRETYAKLTLSCPPAREVPE